MTAGGFITTEKKAQLSGLRIETDPGDEGFLGYKYVFCSYLYINYGVSATRASLSSNQILKSELFCSDGGSMKSLCSVSLLQITALTLHKILIKQTLPSKQKRELLFDILSPNPNISTKFV